MPSRETAARWAALVLVLTGLMFTALAVWSMAARSTVPIALDGEVTTLEMRSEKHPGVDDVWMLSLDDGSPRHVDRDVAVLLEPGDTVRKRAWDTTLDVNGTPYEVAVSDDARTMTFLAPALSLVVVGLAASTGRRSRRSNASAGSAG